MFKPAERGARAVLEHSFRQKTMSETIEQAPKDQEILGKVVSVFFVLRLAWPDLPVEARLKILDLADELISLLRKGAKEPDR